MSLNGNSQIGKLKQVAEKKVNISRIESNGDSTLSNERQNEILKSSKYPKRSLNSPEDCTSLISIFEKSIDYMSEKTEELDKILSEFEHEESLSAIRNKLQGPHKCLKCRKSNLVSKSSCGHLYCEKCTGQLISYSKGCLECSEPFPFKFQIISAVKYLQIDSGQPSILCLNCHKAPIEPIIEGECNHMCMSCISQCYSSHIEECPICFDPLFQNSGYFNYKVRCHSCNKTKSFLTDFFGKIKNCHSMCGSCLERSLESRTCIICKKGLNSMQMIDILRQISDQCAKCKNIISRISMTEGSESLCVSCKS